MSTTIDERVVSMQFDNKQFEKNVATSMSTLEKLKEKLNFKGASKGLENVSDAAKKVDMTTLSDNAETVSKKFSALEIAGITALANITNSAVNTGKQLLKSLSVDQLTAGWTKYEQKTSSIQTIMNSTGKSIDQVNGYLDKLMWYSDETSYGFTDMTASLAQLTSAGGDIEKLIPMIEGIANATAFAGKGATEFSRAIYNLNQSYSAGYLQYMDWRSLELAGVASKQLKEMLISTAEELGKIEKGQIKISNFSQTLKDRWADTEVMETAFGKFAEFTDAVHTYLESNPHATTNDAIDALADKYDKVAVEAFKAAQQAKSFSEAIDATKDAVSSGWMRTYEIIFGNIEEAKKFWGYLTDTLWEAFASGSDDRNNLLSKAFNSGYTTFKDLAGALDDTGFKNHIKAVNKTFAESIDEMIEETGSFEGALRKGLSEGIITSNDLATALNTLTDEYGGLNERQLKNAGFTSEQIKQLQSLNEQIQNGTLSIDDFANKITRLSGRELLLNADETIGELGAIPNILKAIGNLITPIADAFKEIFFGITEDDDNLANRAEGLYKLLEGFRDFTKSLILTDEAMDKLKRTFKGVFAVIDIVLHVVKTLGGAILGPLFDGFKFLSGGVLGATASLGDFLVALRDTIVNSEGLTTMAAGIGSFISKIVQIITNFTTGIYDAIHNSGFGKIVDFLKSVWEIIKTIVNSIAGVIGGLFSSLGNAVDGSGIGGILELLTAGAITTAAVKLSKLFDNVGGILDGFAGILDSVAESVQAFVSSIKARALEKISKAMLMLAASILIIALIDKDTLERSLAAITLLFVGLMGTLTIVGNMRTVFAASQNITAIGVALLLMAFTLKTLSSLDWNSMGVGLVAMTGTLLVLTGALAALALINKKLQSVGNDLDKNSTTTIKGAGQLFKIAVALLPAALLLKILGSMSWKEMGVGLISMTGAIIALTGSFAVIAALNKGGLEIKKGAGQLFKIALALLPMAVVMKILSSMDWADIKKTAIIMGGGLTALLTAMTVMALIDRISNNMNSGTNGIKVVIGKCVQLTLIAWALSTLAIALVALAFVSWRKITKGLIAMGVTLAILLTGLKSISKIEQTTSPKSIFTLIGMAVAVNTLASTLWALGQYKWDTIGKGIASMTGIMAILVASMKILSHGVVAKSAKFSIFGQKLGASEGTPFIRMAASLIVMAGAIKVLSSSLILLGQLKWSTIIKGLTAMAGVMAILIASSRLMTGASVGFVSLAGGIALIGVACLAAGAGIALVAHSLSILGESLGSAIITLCTALYESAPMIGKAAASLIVEMLKALVAVIDELVKSLAEIILNVIKSMSEYLPSFVGAVIELVIGIIDEVVNELPKLAEPISKLLNALFGLIDDVMKNVDTTGMKNIAAAIGILSLAMVALSKISWSAIPKALVGVAGLVTVMGLLTTVAGWLAQTFPNLESTMNEGAKIFGAIGNCIGSFIGGLVGGLSAAYSGATASSMDNVKTIIQSIASPEVITSLLMVVGLTAAITALSKMKVDPMDFSTAISNFSKIFLFITAMTTLFGALAEIDGMSELIQNGTNIITTMCSPEVISSLLMVAGLSAIVTVLSKLKVEPGNFGKAVANMSMAFALITVVTGIFALLAAIPNSQTIFTNGVTLLKTVCSPDVVLALGMVSGLAVVVSGLAALLSKLNVGLKDSAKAIGTIAAVVAFVSAIVVVFSVLALIPGATDFVTKGIEMLELICGPRVMLCIGLAAALMAACAGLRLIVAPAVTGAITLAGFIVAMGALIEKAGGLAQSPGTSFFEGGINLLAMLFGAKMLATLGLAVVVMGACAALSLIATPAIAGLVSFGAFITVLGGIIAALGWLYKHETVQKLIEDGGNALEAIGKAIGKFVSGIIMGIGEGAASSLETIGTSLSNFMSKSAPFFDGLSKFDDDMEKKVKKLAKIIEIIVTEIPRLGGLSGALFGEVNPETFGNGLTKLGEGISAFADSITSDSMSNVEDGINACKKIFDLVKSIPDAGNVFERIFSVDDFANFAVNVGNLGKGVAAFNKAIVEGGVDIGQIETGVNACEKLISLVSNLPDSKMFDRLETIKLKSKFGDLGDAIAKFAKNSKGVNASSIDSAIRAIESLSTSIENFSSSGIDSIIAAFDSSHVEIAKAISRAMNMAILVLNSNVELIKWFNAGKNMIEFLASGIESNSSAAEKESINVLSKASSVNATPYQNNFMTIGKNLISGLTSGISSMAGRAVSAIVSVCSSVISSAKSALRINSPSKVFYAIGSGCGEGLVNSLNDYEKRSADAGYDMAYSSVKGLGNAMKKVESIIGDGIDTQPTIRPVLDLSDVTSGVGTLNSMFDTNPSIGAVSTVNSINRLMTRQNDASNDDVISAINGLKDTIADASGNTYNFGGITYDNGSQVQEAVETLVKAIIVGGRR